jgi:hypothetical protein
MKKVLNNAFVLISFMLCLTSCFDDENSNPVYYYYDEPVVFELSGEKPVIRTLYDKFYAPDLVGDTELQAGDILWSSFIVDLNKEPTTASTSGEYYSADGFRYSKVGSEDVILPESVEEFNTYLSDDYSEPISVASLYKSYIDHKLFFGFTHKEQSNQSYTYELVMDPAGDHNKEYPTLYIRAKKSENTPVAYSKKGEVIFAIDMTDFIDFYRKSVSNSGPVKFNLKYKIGKDEDGKDIYRSFLSNPLSWNIKNL